MRRSIDTLGRPVDPVVDNARIYDKLAEINQRLALIDSGYAVLRAELLAAVGGAIEPLPLPIFTTLPVITSDGTPQIGELLLGVDAAVDALGVNTLTRAWLLYTTVVATTASYTPVSAATYTFRNQIVAPDGTVLATAAANVVVAAAGTGPTPTTMFARSQFFATPFFA
jgi:hypothetical protein